MIWSCRGPIYRVRGCDRTFFSAESDLEAIRIELFDDVVKNLS